MFISHLKIKVLEMSTGRNKVEEWNFLPTNWDHALHDALCDKNFFILDFGTSGKFEFTDTDDILILNMVTRKKFWMRSGTLRTQVEEKAAGRIDLEDFRGGCYFSQMNVENDRIVIKFKISGYGSTLGWFSNYYIYII